MTTKEKLELAQARYAEARAAKLPLYSLCGCSNNSQHGCHSSEGSTTQCTRVGVILAKKSYKGWKDRRPCTLCVDCASAFLVCCCKIDTRPYHRNEVVDCEP